MQSFRTELELPINQQGKTLVEKDIIELEQKIRAFRDGTLTYRIPTPSVEACLCGEIRYIPLALISRKYPLDANNGGSGISASGR